jgi:hypothetical protein
MTEMQPRPVHYYRYRSLFWPIALIGVGLVWLLANLGIISPVSFWSVLRLWPLLLIAIGLDIIFGRRWPAVGALIGIATVVAAVALLVAAPTWAPALGWNAGAEVKSGHFSEPVGNATSARMELHLSDASTTVSALSDSNNLIDANLQYVGDIDFTASGDTAKTVVLRRSGAIIWPFDWLVSQPRRWDIGLNAGVPLDLNVDASSGDATLNLAGMKLKSLAIDASSGSMKVNLPEAPDHYALDARASSGSMSFSVPEGADVEASVSMSSGSMNFDVPNGAAVRVVVIDSSSGSVNVPREYTRTENRGGDKGAWESANFASATQKIVITVTHMSSGSVNVR